MSTATKTDDVPRAHRVEVSDERITAHLVDGRTISVPLSWSWRLSEASTEQWRRYHLIANGEGIRWPDVDEDISVRGMLEGVPARRRTR